MIRIILVIFFIFIGSILDLEGCFFFQDKKSFLSEEGSFFEKVKNHYLSSLDFNLDQTKTDVAIDKLNQFIQKYPDGSKIKEAYRLLNNLLEKIERKNYCIANSYFLMHRYRASLIYFQDLINDFPESSFKEKIMYKICVSQYQLSKKKDFGKSYEKYMDNFPYSSNAKKLKVLYKKLKQ
ncbi:outer membrane protein assembly factor BamD [Blattabacterium cuenoti]|uniref:outer membrane protein assembly factor BamD n=1 Tax=Blattabacterium cuenoti TaxID=1653831 RepID=UPI00163BB17C|nr:outer membrane protein assembly factor BamD [Blattabacterium cuenoti]